MSNHHILLHASLFAGLSSLPPPAVELPPPRKSKNSNLITRETGNIFGMSSSYDMDTKASSNLSRDLPEWKVTVISKPLLQIMTPYVIMANHRYPSSLRQRQLFCHQDDINNNNNNNNNNNSRTNSDPRFLLNFEYPSWRRRQDVVFELNRKKTSLYDRINAVHENRSPSVTNHAIVSELLMAVSPFSAQFITSLIVREERIRRYHHLLKTVIPNFVTNKYPLQQLQTIEFQNVPVLTLNEEQFPDDTKLNGSPILEFFRDSVNSSGNNNNNHSSLKSVREIRINVVDVDVVGNPNASRNNRMLGITFRVNRSSKTPDALKQHFVHKFSLDQFESSPSDFFPNVEVLRIDGTKEDTSSEDASDEKKKDHVVYRASSSSHPRSSLRTLLQRSSYSCDLVNADNAIDILSYFKNHRHLRELRLPKAFNGEACCVALTFPQSPSDTPLYLRVLDLSQNNLSTTGLSYEYRVDEQSFEAAHWESTLTHLPLEILRLSHCGLVSQQIEWDLLPFSTLVELDLSHNSIKGRLFRTSPTAAAPLEFLDLSFNSFEDEGFDFASSLPRNLRYIDLTTECLNKVTAKWEEPLLCEFLEVFIFNGEILGSHSSNHGGGISEIFDHDEFTLKNRFHPNSIKQTLRCIDLRFPNCKSSSSAPPRFFKDFEKDDLTKLEKLDLSNRGFGGQVPLLSLLLADDDDHHSSSSSSAMKHLNLEGNHFYIGSDSKNNINSTNNNILDLSTFFYDNINDSPSLPLPDIFLLNNTKSEMIFRISSCTSLLGSFLKSIRKLTDDPNGSSLPVFKIFGQEEPKNSQYFPRVSFGTQLSATSITNSEKKINNIRDDSIIKLFFGKDENKNDDANNYYFHSQKGLVSTANEKTKINDTETGNKSNHFFFDIPNEGFPDYSAVFILAELFSNSVHFTEEAGQEVNNQHNNRDRKHLLRLSDFCFRHDGTNNDAENDEQLLTSTAFIVWSIPSGSKREEVFQRVIESGCGLQQITSFVQMFLAEQKQQRQSLAPSSSINSKDGVFVSNSQFQFRFEQDEPEEPSSLTSSSFQSAIRKKKLPSLSEFTYLLRLRRFMINFQNNAVSPSRRTSANNFIPIKVAKFVIRSLLTSLDFVMKKAARSNSEDDTQEICCAHQENDAAISKIVKTVMLKSLENPDCFFYDYRTKSFKVIGVRSNLLKLTQFDYSKEKFLSTLKSFMHEGEKLRRLAEEAQQTRQNENTINNTESPVRLQLRKHLEDRKFRECIHQRMMVVNLYERCATELEIYSNIHSSSSRANNNINDNNNDNRNPYANINKYSRTKRIHPSREATSVPSCSSSSLRDVESRQHAEDSYEVKRNKRTFTNHAKQSTRIIGILTAELLASGQHPFVDEVDLDETFLRDFAPHVNEKIESVVDIMTPRSEHNNNNNSTADDNNNQRRGKASPLFSSVGVDLLLPDDFKDLMTMNSNNGGGGNDETSIEKVFADYYTRENNRSRNRMAQLQMFLTEENYNVADDIDVANSFLESCFAVQDHHADTDNNMENIFERLLDHPWLKKQDIDDDEEEETAAAVEFEKIFERLRKDLS